MEQNGKDDGKINVFTPELTFRDGEIYYGDIAPTDFAANRVFEIWKHGDTTSTDQGVVMTGDVPVLDITYTPVEHLNREGRVNTKQVMFCRQK